MSSSGMITENNKHLLDRAIYEHLLREGRMDVAEALMKVNTCIQILKYCMILFFNFNLML